MISEPEPTGDFADVQPKIIGTKNIQIVRVVSKTCKEFSEIISNGFLCSTKKNQEGNMNEFLEDSGSKQ